MKKICAILFALSLLLTGCASTPAPEPEGPIRLTLGGIHLSGTPVEASIKEFNKSQSRISVVIRDYALETDSIEQAELRMNTEALSGHAPDLLYFPLLNFDAEMTRNEGSPLPFIAQGLLLNLDPFVKNSPDLKPDDFMVWDALHQYGGMYLLSDTFTLQTLSCSPDFYAEHQNWTFEEYQEIVRDLEPDVQMFCSMRPELFILDFASRYLSKAIDMENATCDFDNAEFISILNDAQNVDSHEFEWTGVPVQQQMLDGKTMVSNRVLYSPHDLLWDRFCTTWEDEVPDDANGTNMCYIGWPTLDGISGTEVRLDGALGISAAASQPDACWELLHYVLTHWHRAESAGLHWGMPVYRLAYPYCLEEIRKTGKNATQEDMDCMAELAARCKKLNYYDPGIMDIIQEETGEMLKGHATPEETAKRIQSRASLYVAEQYG